MKTLATSLATATALLCFCACSDAPNKPAAPEAPTEEPTDLATPAEETEAPQPTAPPAPAPDEPETDATPDATVDSTEPSADTTDTASAAVPAEGETRLLSSHDTIATFRELKPHRCMGRTALCPDNCGHSGSLAIFDIIRYNDYQKPGQYGDPQAETFQILVMDNHGNAKIDKAILKTINDLSEGDTVTLKWRHDYVTRNQSSFPVRTITELTPQP
ncbi:hypothetical protein [Sulfuriroseicoccus oceanibius]|uniref:Lipoprotein n=1 Tax=Sulfuriroseicoccus oceanibius TaxID=2707525 RepID=A0A6B3LBA2_9BACT|nr:hypothetical protein [Sulfuriroseicoccus oceanibius]QQL45937.1 hypothetical protein G3M56_004985 [Sulfuriroseicoccus oceanibius]